MRVTKGYITFVLLLGSIQRVYTPDRGSQALPIGGPQVGAAQQSLQQTAPDTLFTPSVPLRGLGLFPKSFTTAHSRFTLLLKLDFSPHPP